VKSLTRRVKKDKEVIHVQINSITSRQIAMAFTGSILGAGFVSGQELMQFFAVFGSYGLMGMLLAVLMLLLLSCLVMKIANRTGITEFDKIIVRKEIPWLRAVFGGVFVFFLFGVIVIMIAGAGALLNQVLSIPALIGNVLMTVFLGVVALWEARGVLTAFSITVPVLIVVAVISGILSFVFIGGSNMVARPFSQENPLLGNWLFSAILFVSYNMMVIISILVPIAPEVAGDRIIHRGVFQGALQLLIIFACILLPLIFNQPALAGTELPMLTLAERIHPIWGLVYAVLLFCGMFGSSLSCLFGVTYRIKKIKNVKGTTLIPALMATAFMGSIVGFKELIGIILPICGYLGFFAMIGIVMHFLSLQQNA
jgi:uncharacterized membrane protein YkvI